MEFRKFTRKNDKEVVEVALFHDTNGEIDYILKNCNDYGDFALVKNVDGSRSLALLEIDENDETIVYPLTRGTYIVKGINIPDGCECGDYEYYVIDDRDIFKDNFEPYIEPREAEMPIATDNSGKKGVDNIQQGGHYSVKIYNNGKPVFEYEGSEAPNEETQKKIDEAMNKMSHNINNIFGDFGSFGLDGMFKQ